MVEVSVIVPLWNRSDLTHSFLFRNVQLYRNAAHVEFVMVNNGSTDNTRNVLELWQSSFGERMIVVDSPENLGFSGGNNKGVAAISPSSKTLVFLSNDVTPLGDYITPLMAAVDQSALFGAELLEHDTGWNTFAGVTFPYLTGWCIFADREIWERHLGWDERYYPCDYEDIDLSLEAGKHGLDIQSVDLPLAHMSGQSAQAINGGRAGVTDKNRKLFMEKWTL